VHRTLVGIAAGVGLALALGALMLPWRDHLSVATCGLVLVVPVVIGALVGGTVAGAASVVAGFLVYDVWFIPPYGTLTVGAGEHWVALVVYVLVMVLVTRIVAALDAARASARRREENLRHLLELSERLLPQRTVADLAHTIVHTAREVVGAAGSALLFDIDGHLEVAAAAGDPIDAALMARLAPRAGLPVPLSTGHAETQTLALSTSGRPVGLLVLRGVQASPEIRELLPIFANDVAIALERAQLQERMHRVELLEEVDRLRHALVGAVSHDLRTPLASIKVASSTLVATGPSLPASDAAELYGLIDVQVDRLTRMVNDVLDMTRIEAGVLEPRTVACAVLDLVVDALGVLGSTLDEREIDIDVGAELPMVKVDRSLIVQVLTNLVENAQRHAPIGTPISIAAEALDGFVAISVVDRGPGVPRDEREAVFERFVRFDTGGRAGLGLAVAHAFVEAHGGSIRVEDQPGGGARFVFTVPLVPVGVAS
jgi:two-component system, OmpR family, sensor histidine kinase KdpD